MLLSVFFVHQKASASDYRSRGREFEPMSVVKVCTSKVLVNRLKGLSLPRDSVSRLTERLDMPLIPLTWQ